MAVDHLGEQTIDQVNLSLKPKFARYCILSCNLFKLFELVYLRWG